MAHPSGATKTNAFLLSAPRCFSLAFGRAEWILVHPLEVHPLKGYGAVEIGIHRFHHPGHPEDGVGNARFVTLWQNKNGTWKVTRVISYDHNQALLAK